MKQYSNRAMAQLNSTMAMSPKRSRRDLKAMCPYHASVMKALEMTSRTMVERPRNMVTVSAFEYLFPFKSGAKIDNFSIRWPLLREFCGRTDVRRCET